MGISTKKTKTENTPWAPAQPYILQNLQDTKNTYDANQPKLQNYATQQQDAYGRLSPGAESGVMGAQSLVNSNLSGANLNGNPYLEGIIGKTNRDVTNSVNGMFNAAGRFGSSANQGVLAEKIAEADNAARFQNYNMERGYQQAAIGDAQNLMGGATGLLNNAAQLPWVGVQAQNGGTNSLTNGYGVQTTTTKDPMGAITGIAGAGLKAYSTLSDARAKDVGERVGTTPDGLPVYDYTYKGDDTPQTGVIAQDVAQVRPDAVQQRPDGMLSVDYGKLGMPDPTTLAQTTTAQVGAKRMDAPGFDGFIDRFTNPDTTTGRGRAGLLGDYLMAAEGSPFQALGRGLIGSRDDAFRKDEAAASLAERRGLIGAQTEYYKSRAAGEGAPKATPVQLQILAAMGVDPQSERGQAMLERSLNGYGYSPDAVAAKASAAAGVKAQPTYSDLHPKEPAAPKPAKVSKTSVVGGKAYYQINGRWYDNPEGN